MDPTQAYSHIRGFNYTPGSAFNDIAFWRNYDEKRVERELGYAQRLGLNSARVFLSYVVYEREPGAFLERLRHFVRAAHERGISVMPTLWDSCFDDMAPAYDSRENRWIPNPGVQRLGPDFWPAGERYCQDIVATLAGEPGLLMWDIMNEPLCTTWLEAPRRAERTRTIWAFVHHFCAVMKGLDAERPLTMGFMTAANLPPVAGQVDVLSFHDYSPTRDAVRRHFDRALDLAKACGKPLLVSEVGCMARSNPYDMTLEICQEFGMGWFVRELMIGVNIWRDIHGLVYPDGTVRDPGAIAALRGFFRKREGNIIAVNLDKEQQVSKVCRDADAWRAGDSGTLDEGLHILERMANLLEGGELVPLHQLPTRAVNQLRKNGARSADRKQINVLMLKWHKVLLQVRNAGPGHDSRDVALSG